MAILEIQKGDIPILRQKSEPLKCINQGVLQLVEDMFETMTHAGGIGLAAPQVGVSKQVIVVDISPHFPDCPRLVLINPLITDSTGEKLGEEGCLSLPGDRGMVRRASSVTVQALLPSGENTEMKVNHLMARVLQHEIDHLNGILFIDLLRSEDQELLKNEETLEAAG
ncbi:MAG: peptide deformylase [Candidatus Poribacteria bacterium]|nr:peptide deformylase [Candidatus Poribacteria bacterium]MDE0503697.1 peptide deformylase [Candidatus Poribacteria bacterium]